jgi:anti-sigma B factor antagonist
MMLEVVPCQIPSVRLVQASGELDVTRAPALLAEVESLVSGAGALVLDLTAVSFFDSAGVRLVDRIAQQCHRQGAGFRVAAPAGSRARRVLELVGMAGQLVSDDVPTALEEVRQQDAGPTGDASCPRS